MHGYFLSHTLIKIGLYSLVFSLCPTFSLNLWTRNLGLLTPIYNRSLHDSQETGLTGVDILFLL